MDDFEQVRASDDAAAVRKREQWRSTRSRLPVAAGATLVGAVLLVVLSDLTVLNNDALPGFLSNLWHSVGNRSRAETVVGVALVGLIGFGAMGWAVWPVLNSPPSRVAVVAVGCAVVLIVMAFASQQRASVMTGEQVIAGQVDGPDEAFCAGFSATLKEVDTNANPEMADLGSMTFDECLEAGFPEAAGVPADAQVENAYAVGCAAVISMFTDAGGGLDEEAVLSIAYSVCYHPFDELHPDNRGMGPVAITEQGLCYPGLGAGAVLPGCLDEEGNYVTTTTISFTGDAGRNSAVLISARDAFGDTLAGIGGESEVLDYASRVCDLYESGYGYEFTYEVADLRDNAVAWPGVAAEDLARFKSAAWDFTADVVAELCPEHGDDVAADRAEFAGTTWQPSVYGFAGRLGYAFDGIETTDPGGWGHHYEVYRDLGRDFWVDFALEVCRDLDRGIGYGSVREAVLGVLRSDGSGETEADAFFGYQISVAITYDLCPRHYTRFHDFEQP